MIGITADASGQYANSGDSDKRGIIMAIEEWNAKGGRAGSPHQVRCISTPRPRPPPARASPSA